MVCSHKCNICSTWLEQIPCIPVNQSYVRQQLLLLLHGSSIGMWRIRREGNKRTRDLFPWLLSSQKNVCNQAVIITCFWNAILNTPNGNQVLDGRRLMQQPFEGFITGSTTKENLKFTRVSPNRSIRLFLSPLGRYAACKGNCQKPDVFWSTGAMRHLVVIKLTTADITRDIINEAMLHMLIIIIIQWSDLLYRRMQTWFNWQ